MAVLNWYDFDTLGYDTTEEPNEFYSGPQTAPGYEEDHIRLSTNNPLIGTNCLRVEIVDGLYRNSYPLCRSEVRTQVFGGYPNVMQGWRSFSFRAGTLTTGEQNGVIHQLWDGDNPTHSIRWYYNTNQVISRIHGGPSNVNHNLFIASTEWTHVDIYYQARPDSSGILKIWINGMLTVDYQGRTSYATEMNSTTPYPKLGIYSASFGQGDLPNRVAYFDAVSFHDDSDSEVDTLAWINNFRTTSYNGPDYYVKNGGDDDALGDSDANAFETLDHAYGLTVAGDNVLLKRGHTFHEELDATRDGANGDPITIKNYGSGDLPVISGLKPVTNFSLVSGNIYESHDATYPADIYGLLIGNTEVPKGRFPKNDYLRGSTTTTTVTSAQLPSIDFTTGEVEALVHKNPWIHDLVTISGRSGNTITYSGGSSYGGGANQHFYLQNAIEFLTEDGDWMYSPSEKKIYFFSTTNPNARNIQVIVNDYNINGNGNSDNAVDGVEFKGSGIQGYDAEVSSRLLVENSTFRHHNEGIALRTASNAVLQNLLIEYCKKRGVAAISESANTLLTDSAISNIGFIPSKLSNGDGSGFAVYATSTAGATIDYNEIENVAYSGIRLHGNNAYAGKNEIDRFCLLKHDGGGIYVYGGQKNTSTFTGRIIEKNIILNGGNTFAYQAFGIYIDDNSENINIHHNLIKDIQSGGYFNHNSHEILFNDNIIYGAGIGVIFAQNGDNELIRNNDILRNVFVITSKNHLACRVYSEANDIDQFATINNNLYLVASNQQIVFSTRVVVSGKLTFKNHSFAEWQAFGFDADSEVRYLNIPEYSITSEGANKWDGTAGSYHAGGSATVTTNDNTLYPGAVKVEMTSPSATTTRVELFLQVGALDKDKDYIFRFKASAPSGSQSLISYARQTATPYLHLTNSIYIKITDELTEFEFLLPKLRFSDSNCGLMFDCQSDEGTLYITNFELVEAVVDRTDYDEYFNAVYNATKVTANVDFEGEWEDVDGDPVTSPISLQSYESRLLIAPQEDPNQGPTAVAEADVINGDAPLTVQFTGSNSTDDVEIASYFWDFGDGNTSTDTDPEHQFTEPGEYTVTLTVKDAEDMEDTDTVVITVTEVVPDPEPSVITVRGRFKII